MTFIFDEEKSEFCFLEICKSNCDNYFKLIRINRKRQVYNTS